MSDSNNKDPWSGRDRQGPPDLTQLFAKWFGKSKKSFKPGGGNSAPEESKVIAYVAGLVVLIVIIIWFVSGFYIVPPTDRAPVLRFGKYQTTQPPGLHWVARGISRPYPVNVQTIHSVDFTSDMLTQDENIVSVQLAVQYRVADAQEYLFNVVNPVNTLQQVVSSVMRQVVGDTTLDSILTTGRSQVRDAVEKQVVAIIKPYNTGILVTDVNLQPAKPPSAVTAAFDDAINAREDKQKYVNKAQAYENKVLSIVKGQVVRLQQQADAYKAQVVQKSYGATARYLALLKPYQFAPIVTRERMYYDAMGSILSSTVNVVDESHGRNMMYLPLGGHQKLVRSSEPEPQIQAAATIQGQAGAKSNLDSSDDSSSASQLLAPYAGSQRPSYSAQGGN